MTEDDAGPYMNHSQVDELYSRLKINNSISGFYMILMAVLIDIANAIQFLT